MARLCEEVTMDLGRLWGIIATPVMGVTIWLIQELRSKKALERQREDIKKDLWEVLPAIMAVQYAKRTGEPVPPEFTEIADASAKSLGAYVSPSHIGQKRSGARMKARVTFQKCIQDSQDFGSDDEHMISRVFLTLEAGDSKQDLVVDVKQIVGSRFEDAPLEVSSPKGYKGPLNYTILQKEVEEYYRESFGSRGHAIRIGAGANIRMRNNTVIRQKIVEIEIGDQESKSW